MNILISYLITITAFLIALTFHEFCHALTAYMLGDDTAKRLGRLTLNPLAHIDPLGFLFLILVNIGWAKPVPFNAHNFSYPRLFSVLVALAGPFSNFLLALLGMYALNYSPAIAAPYGIQFFKTSILINVMLGLFNLLPIPPLDGSHLIAVTIPFSWRRQYATMQQFGFILLIILLMIPAVQKAFFYGIYLVTDLLEKLVF